MVDSIAIFETMPISIRSQFDLRPKASDRSAASLIPDLRSEARAWSESINEGKRRQAASAFVKLALDRYVDESSVLTGQHIVVSAPTGAHFHRLPADIAEIAARLGRYCARLPIDNACYELSNTYTALLPYRVRSALGMYYTPPALASRLLDMAEEAGVDWLTATVLDPACGGGAFLLPVALRMRASLAGRDAKDQLASIAARLRGFEIDPFAAWLTQVWLEIALSDLAAGAGKRLPPLASICDALRQQPDGRLCDLVVGNPPYGRVTLAPEQRTRFARSLFGHANLYGVFTDLALQWTKPKGVIAYVTPTSFLAGEYFKNLRALLAAEAPPNAVDFVSARRGVFDDVLQETLLATYRRSARVNGASVHYLDAQSASSAKITYSGNFTVPRAASSPWLAPRVPAHRALTKRLAQMPHRLADWGYKVSTGPLVWNRHKSQLRARPDGATLPLIWAEAVAPGRFRHRADKRNHQPWFHIDGPADNWLKTDQPCVLVQRTTAKEQARRLIAAELPPSFIKKHRAVVVENHLNMVRTCDGSPPRVSPAAVSAMLNSEIVDAAFRCISGSVAVSAFELEALPLPGIDQMRAVELLLERGVTTDEVDAQIRRLYVGEERA